MMKALLPILLAVIGIGGGIGAGLMFKPAPERDKAEVACLPGETTEAMAAVLPEEEETAKDYVKLNNQFVVPVIVGERVGAMVVLSLSLEVPPGEAEQVYAREPKLRDLFLQVLFDHANVGGFDGAFTEAGTLDVLRRALLEVSHHALGDLVSDVLITDIARQDV